MNERIKRLAEQAGGIWIKHPTAFLSGTLNIERFAELVRQDYLRELKALKPVGYMDKNGILFNDTTHPHLNTPLYALDEMTK